MNVHEQLLHLLVQVIAQQLLVKVDVVMLEAERIEQRQIVPGQSGRGARFDQLVHMRDDPGDQAEVECLAQRGAYLGGRIGTQFGYENVVLILDHTLREQLLE